VNTGSLSSIPPTTDCQHACVHKRDVGFECAVLVGVMGAQRFALLPPQTDKWHALLVGVVRARRGTLIPISNLPLSV